MNRSMVIYILGWVLVIEGVLMSLPLICAIIYKESSGIWFLWIMFASIALGFAITRKKPENRVFYFREGCVATALSWILISLVGALPFYLSGSIPHYIDALFETVSGFTTTGSSILTDVEALPKGMLFWRSFTHWIGGMGVLVFLMAVIKTSGGSDMNLMRAESPGPSVGKFVPKAMSTARLLYVIYMVMTIIEIVLLLLGNMPLFDALTLSFGSAGTGGFVIKNTGCLDYTAYQQWIITIFMILFGVNFNFYCLLVFKKAKDAFKIEEVRDYFLVILGAIVIIMAKTYDGKMPFLTLLRHVSFTVGSIITTTGYATLDFDKWSTAAKVVIVSIMFIGACAGSTGGGIKVSRFAVAFKTIFKELGTYIYPKSVKKVKMDGKPVDHEVIRGINVFFVTFLILFSLSVLLISFEGKDLVTTFTSVAATINNIGPGLNIVGPTGNFSSFTIFSKLILIFDMLAGRLELFPMLLLFYPPTWKGFFWKRR